MRYYIYIPLPPALARRVAAIEERFGSYTASKPHITVVSPREKTRGTRERQVVQAIGDAAATLAAFPITYGGVSYFGRKEYIYIAVRKTRRLADCHRSCMAGVDGLMRPPALGAHPVFRPHITLVSRLMREDGQKVWNALKEEAFGGTFVCTELLLVRKGRTDQAWRLVSAFALGA